MAVQANDSGGDMRVDSDVEVEVVPIILPIESTPAQGSKFKLTVEIPCLLIAFAASFTGGITSNLLIYRTCLVDFAYNASTCDLLQMKNKTDEAKDLEVEVQSEVTILVMAVALYGGIVPAILSIFLGSWSDKHGRKPLVMWPSLGLLASSILTTIYTAIPTIGAWWYMVCIIPFTLFGGSTAINLGIVLLVTDLSDETTRAFRLSIVQGLLLIGLMVGTVSSGYSFEAIGFFNMYLIATFIFLISGLYIIFFVEESLVGAEKPSLRTLFNCETLRDMAETCSKPRTSSIATIISLLITAFGLVTICMNGNINMEYLFTREQFQWNLKDYSIFSAINMMFTVIGLFFGLAFFKKVCKMNEGVLLILAFLSSISDSTLKGFAKFPWQMYFASTTAILGGLSLPLIRSQVAKIILTDEIGKMFSLISLVEAITPVFSPMLYSSVYHATLATFPGTIYLISSSFYILGFIFVTIAEVLTYRLRRSPQFTVFNNDMIQPSL